MKKFKVSFQVGDVIDKEVFVNADSIIEVKNVIRKQMREDGVQGIKPKWNRFKIEEVE